MTAPRRIDARHKRQLAIGAIVVSALVLLVFPLQTILSAILAGSVWIVSMAVVVWMERNVEARDRDRILRAVPLVAVAAVGLGIVLTFVMPMTMAAVTLLLAFAAAASMIYLTVVERAVKAEHRERELDELEAQTRVRSRRRRPQAGAQRRAA